MKVVDRPIEVYSWTDVNGKIHPFKLQLKEKNELKELKIDKVVDVKPEKQAGIQRLVYSCQSEIKGTVRPFEIRYELNSCKWVLFKI